MGTDNKPHARTGGRSGAKRLTTIGEVFLTTVIAGADDKVVMYETILSNKCDL